MGNRSSSLDRTQYCSASGRYQNAGSRASVKGSAFHAVCSEVPDRDEWLAKLTEEERGEIDGWHKPTPLEICDDEGNVVMECRYEHASTETEVALNKEGGFCKADDPDIMTLGHLDMAWVVEIDGVTTAVVGDIKTSLFTSEPTSLQLASYALAVADLSGAESYITAIWGAVEGQWRVAPSVDVFEAGKRLEAVRFAALNLDGKETTGNHCSGCYGWQQCRAYTLIASNVDGMQWDEEITEANAANILMQAEAAAKFADVTKKRLKLYAEKTPILDGNGKQWKQIMGKGREGVMGVKKLREAMGEDAEKYISRGPAVGSFRWVNEEKKK